MQSAINPRLSKRELAKLWKVAAATELEIGLFAVVNYSAQDDRPFQVA